MALRSRSIWFIGLLALGDKNAKNAKSAKKTPHRIFFAALAALAFFVASPSSAQPAGRITGRVTDETGGALPGVTVQLRSASRSPIEPITSAGGVYAVEKVQAARASPPFPALQFPTLPPRDAVGETGPPCVDRGSHPYLNDGRPPRR